MSLADYPIITGVGDGVGVGIGLADSSGGVDSAGASGVLIGSVEDDMEGGSSVPDGLPGPGTSVDGVGGSVTIVSVGGRVADASGDGLSGTTTTVLSEYGVTLGRGVGVGIGVDVGSVEGLGSGEGSGEIEGSGVGVTSSSISALVSGGG